MTNMEPADTRPTVPAYLVAMAPKDAVAVVAFALAIGRLWQDAVDADGAWEDVVRAARVAALLPCGLPSAIDRGDEKALLALPAEARAVVNAYLGTGATRFRESVKTAYLVAGRRIAKAPEAEADVDLRALDVFACLLAGSASIADADAGMALFGATEIHFDADGWPESFRLNPRTATVTTGADGDVEAIGIAARAAAEALKAGEPPSPEVD